MFNSFKGIFFFKFKIVPVMVKNAVKNCFSKLITELHAYIREHKYCSNLWVEIYLQFLFILTGIRSQV